MKLKYAYLFIVGLIIICSCKNDDDDNVEVIPPRLLSEVAAEDDEEIVEFLKTHFYNEDEFEAAADDFDFKIRFDTIAGENETKRSIYDSPALITDIISVESSDLGRDDGEVVSHKLYTLVARQGAKPGKPTIGDFSILRYEGSLLNGTKFDASTNQPVRFNLSSVVRGFGNGVKNFQTGNGPIDNPNGTVSYEDYGVGAIFIPAGLGYFDGSPNSVIPNYSPLVFKIDAFDYEPDSDFDEDGIPSIQEDLNGNGNLNDDNTDDETEGFSVYLANFNDSDDDGDGIPTIDEIKIDGVIKKDENGIVQFPDTDNDGIPDHLDNDF